MYRLLSPQPYVAVDRISFHEHREELMFTSLPAVWLASLTAFVALSAGAQTAPATGTPPAMPPSLSYRSAMDGYKSFADEKPVPWKAANETVRSRGGWRAYAQEASGEPADPKKAAAAADPHAGHAMPAAKEKP